MKILIASHNQGKIKEFEQLFKDYSFEVVSLLDYPELDEVEETGQTFEENARLKAETIANQLNVIAIADDSGLVVDDLDGQPGVYSARYSGEPKDDQRNNQKLLTELAKLPESDRKAHFTSCIVVAYPNYESLVVEGHVEGVILTEARGQDGFGYDPLFYYPPKQQTFAELGLSEKNKISHRSQAFIQLMKEFPQWVEGIR